MYKIILASSSKNRKTLLQNINIPFEVDFPICNEESIQDTSALILTQKRARAKAESLIEKYQAQNVILIGCDTVIECGGVVFGKPKNCNEVKAMFLDYEGKSHKVHSSICCINAFTLQSELATSTSSVFFSNFEANELDDYIKSGEWKEVSGGYRLQGLASRFIKKIEGSPSGIIGLPIHELFSLLKKIT